MKIIDYLLVKNDFNMKLIVGQQENVNEIIADIGCFTFFFRTSILTMD